MPARLIAAFRTAEVVNSTEHMQGRGFSDTFVLGVPAGGSSQGHDRWMLPVHCQGLLYTPRLLAVMLLLARHLRCTNSTQVEGSAADGYSLVGADSAAIRVAGAVCEGRAQRSSLQPGLPQRSTTKASAAIPPARRTKRASFPSKFVKHGLKGATAPRQPDTCSNTYGTVSYTHLTLPTKA